METASTPSSSAIAMAAAAIDSRESLDTRTAYDRVLRTMYENMHNGVEATGLGKRFGDLWALRDVDLSVPAGTVLGLLGHNGAGKTTAIRLLTTLARPTTGRGTVAGVDGVEDA